MTKNYQKVTEQSKLWLENTYYPAKNNKLNLSFKGGRNYSLHKQYNEIINLLVDNTTHNKNYETSCKVFTYHCVIHYLNGKGFVVTRDTFLIDKIHKETQGRTPTSYQWLQVQDTAVVKGLGEVFIGGEDQDGNYIPSVFIMSEKLLGILDKKKRSLSPLKPKEKKEEVIIWDQEDKRERKQIKLRGIKSHKDQIKAFNTFMMDFDVRDSQGVKISTDLHSVFIKYFNNYGRVFHSYQGTPQDIRSGITINGEAVCEGDYSSNHARIAYEEVGIFKGAEFKPYHIPNELCTLTGTCKGKRLIYKLAMMMIFNSGNPSISLYRDLEKKYNKIKERKEKGLHLSDKLLPLSEVVQPSLKECSDVIRNIKQVNIEISSYFKGCQAGYLQNVDSRIAKEVMSLLMEQGIPFIPYHDSFQVPKSKALQLEQAMHEAWENILGSRDNCIVDFKYGVSFPDDDIDSLPF